MSAPGPVPGQPATQKAGEKTLTECFTEVWKGVDEVTGGGENSR